MVIKINSLSEQQIAEFATYREKWIRIALSTDSTDVIAVKDIVKQYYEILGLTVPRLIICTDSPLSAMKALDVRNKEIVGNVIMDRVWNQVTSKIRGKVSNRIWDQVNNQVRYKVLNQVAEQVENHVWNHIGNRNVNFHRGRYGCHDAGWLSFYDYLREVCGLVKETEEITGLIALAKRCGWWVPYKDIVIIQHRPCFIGFDDDKQLHCDNGMAIKYRDGFGVWAIHGIRVDEQIVMKPHEQTIKQITEEGNAEKKRIRIERFGWNRYLTKINAKVIDSRHNEIENTYETLVETPDGMTILLTTCKTGRLFALEVPYSISTCEQAQNWLHGGSRLDGIVGKTRVVGRS